MHDEYVLWGEASRKEVSGGTVPFSGPAGKGDLIGWTKHF